MEVLPSKRRRECSPDTSKPSAAIAPSFSNTAISAGKVGRTMSVPATSLEVPGAFRAGSVSTDHLNTDAIAPTTLEAGSGAGPSVPLSMAPSTGAARAGPTKPAARSPIRKTCTKLIENALGKGQATLAGSIEDAVASLFGWAATDGYKTRIKSRVSNIKSNKKFRTSIIAGAVLPARVATMSVEEMRSEGVVRVVTEKTTAMLVATQMPESHTLTISSWLVCPACKDDDVTILTTPVAGEASKKNLQCNVCGHEWIDDPETPNAAGM